MEGESSQRKASQLFSVPALPGAPRPVETSKGSIVEFRLLR